MTELYRVIISGRTLSGGALVGAREAVGQLFRLQGEQLDRMLCGQPVVVARSLAAEAAEKLLARLHSVDLEARAEALNQGVGDPPAITPIPEKIVSPASDELFALVHPVVSESPPSSGGGGTIQAESPALDAVICPKCGESQPKRTLCRQCGLDMPRFHAAQEAQEAQEREARENRAANRAERRTKSGSTPQVSGGQQASLLGFSFTGRLGRLDFFSSWLLSGAFWTLMLLLAVATDKNAFSGLGLVVTTLYGIRCIVLRLHDGGRTGWLALIIIVPIINLLMVLFLQFSRGDDDSNDYGDPPMSAGGGRTIVALIVYIIASSLFLRSASESPEKALRFIQAMRIGQDNAAPGKAEKEATVQTKAKVRYASNNRIDIYVTADCSDCEKMRAWLRANGLRPTVYSVDRDPRAAERLHSIMASSEQIQLPVLEVNGKVLKANPAISEVRDYLRKDTGG